MSKTISKIAIAEMSIMRKGYVGKNPDAVAFAVKGEEVAAKPSFLDRLTSMFGANKEAAGGAVATEKGWYIPDDVEITPALDGTGDGVDGAEDYDTLAGLICACWNDVSSAFYISGESARVSAIVAALDTFRANYADLCSGGDGDVAKGGKRNSKADQEKLDAIAGHADAIKELYGELSDTAQKGAPVAPVAVAAVAAQPEPGAPEQQPAAAEKPQPAEVPAAAKPADEPADKGGAAPSTAEAPVMPALSAADLTAAVLKGLAPEFVAIKAHVDGKLADHITAVDAKLGDVTAKVDEVAKGAQATQRSALEASAAAVTLARQPTAPGGIATRVDETTVKGAAITGETVGVEITPDMTAGAALRSVFNANIQQ